VGGSAAPSDTLIAVSVRPAIVALVQLVAEQIDWAGEVRAIDAAGELDATGGIASNAIVVLDREETTEPLERDVLVVRAAIPSAHIVVLAADVDGVVTLEGLRLGVRGFLRSPEDLSGLGDVLRRVAHGELAMPSDLRTAATDELGLLARRLRAGIDADAALTPRERQVLALLADGLTSRQIGSRLAISPRTVERHASGVYRKLDVRTRVQAVARAASMGLVDVR